MSEDKRSHIAFFPSKYIHIKSLPGITTLAKALYWSNNCMHCKERKTGSQFHVRRFCVKQGRKHHQICE